MTITESKLRDMIHEELIKYLIDEGILDEGLMDIAKSKLAPYALGLGLGAAGLGATAGTAQAAPGGKASYSQQQSDLEMYAGPAWRSSDASGRLEKMVKKGEVDSASADLLKQVWQQTYHDIIRGPTGGPSAPKEAEAAFDNALDDLKTAGSAVTKTPKAKPSPGVRKSATGDRTARAINALLKGADAVKAEMTKSGFSSGQISKALGLINAGDMEGAQKYIAGLR